MNPALRLALLLASALAATAAPAQNLVQNPGFETGDFTNWTSTGPFQVVSTFDPHSGVYEALFDDIAPGTLSQSVATVPGAAYVFSFYLAESYLTNNASFSAAFGGTTVLALSKQTGSSGYVFESFSVTATSTSSAVTFTAQSSPGPFILDDVSVSPTPEPSALAALALGVLTLLRRRRRA